MGNCGRLGQVSIEFLMIVGFALLMTLPLFYLFFKQTEQINTEISAGQVDKVASELRDAADEVYYLGVPSKKTLTIYLPEQVQNITFSNSNISGSMVFTVDSVGGDYEVVKWTVGNISSSSSISPTSGIHHIYVEAQASDILIKDK
jgi:hypothetical protein